MTTFRYPCFERDPPSLVCINNAHVLKYDLGEAIVATAHHSTLHFPARAENHSSTNHLVAFSKTCLYI